MSELTPQTLSEAIAQLGPYPIDHPQTLTDLLAADPESINHDLAWFLRKQVLNATRAGERHYVRGPGDVLNLLKNGYALHSWENTWVSYGLSADRQVILMNDDKGGMRSMRKATPLLPKSSDLPNFPASAKRGTKPPAWLVIYGGTPEVLEKDHVTAGLNALVRSVPVADICFYASDPEAGLPPTLWSVRARSGVSASSGRGSAVPFPNLEKLSEVNL